MDTNAITVEFVDERRRKQELADTFTPERVEQFVTGGLTLGQLYGITIEEAYTVAEFGYTFFEQGRLKEAQTVFQSLVLSNPYDGYFHSVLGAIYQKLGLITGALEEYSIAIGLDPSDIPSLVNRGEIFLRLGGFEEAAADFRRAIGLDPQGKNKS